MKSRVFRKSCNDNFHITPSLSLFKRANNPSWSRYILGTESSDSIVSPIGKFYKSIYPNLRYRTEDVHFDLLMSLHQNVHQITTLNGNYELVKYDLKEPVFYPSRYVFKIQ